MSSSSSSLRPRRRNTKPDKQPSASLYLGYVEDEETPEMIERKFKELERIEQLIQKKKAASASASSSSASPALNSELPAADSLANDSSAPSAPKVEAESSSPPPDKQQNGIDFDAIPEEMQVELFKRTSYFSLNQFTKGEAATRNPWISSDFEALDEEYFDEFEDDFDTFGDDCDETYDQEDIEYDESGQPVPQQMQPKPTRASRKKTSSNASGLPSAPTASGSSSRRPSNRNANGSFQPFSYGGIGSRALPGGSGGGMSSGMDFVQSFGSSFILKKRARSEHPLQVEFVRLPPDPIPTPWGRIIEPYRGPDPDPFTVQGARYFETDDVISFLRQQAENGMMEKKIGVDLEDPVAAADSLLNVPTEIGGGYEAMYLNPPWDYVKPEQLESIPFDVLLPRGYIFIWIEKEHVPDIVRLLDKHAFAYVENLVWVKLRPNNTFATQPSPYFAKSKSTLFIFKKENEETRRMDIRHQRNPDVVFDFFFVDEHGIESKPGSTYDMIETLLPTAQYSEAHKCGKMLELWAPQGQSRQGWTSIAQSNLSPPPTS